MSRMKIGLATEEVGGLRSWELSREGETSFYKCENFPYNPE